MRVLGVNDGHNAAACLYEGGRIVAAALLERQQQFDRPRRGTLPHCVRHLLPKPALQLTFTSDRHAKASRCDAASQRLRVSCCARTAGSSQLMLDRRASEIGLLGDMSHLPRGSNQTKLVIPPFTTDSRKHRIEVRGNSRPAVIPLYQLASSVAQSVPDNGVP